MMKKMDITQHVLEARKQQQQLAQEKENALRNAPLPDWLQTPFEQYFDTHPRQADTSNVSVKNKESNTTNNVVNVNFGSWDLQIPKALAAASANLQTSPWYAQGGFTLPQADGSQLDIVFSKASDSNEIDMDITVEGDSLLFDAYKGTDNMSCTLLDGETVLAELHAFVSDDGGFIHAEGRVVSEFDGTSRHSFITFRFNPQH